LPGHLKPNLIPGRPWDSATSDGPLTFIIGAPRSGTTWLAKILDSHPDVLYRHEPDLTVKGCPLPSVCDQADYPSLAAPARAFVDRLIAARDLKSVGSLPVFRKSFDRPLGRAARVAAVLGVRLADRYLGLPGLRTMQLPEFHDPKHTTPRHVVIKSVSALGRAGLLADALPHARIIFLVRFPMGQIASRYVGVSTGRFRPFQFDPALLLTPQAVQLGVTAHAIEQATMVEQMAWEWAILNQKASDDLAGRANVRTVQYADLVEDPLPRAREVLHFAGLDWDDACESFLRRSVEFRGPDSYFQVYRQGTKSLTKWRGVLSGDDQSRIARIVSATQVGRSGPEQFA